MIGALLLALLSVPSVEAGAGDQVPAGAPADASASRGDAYFRLMKARLAAGDGRVSEAVAEVRAAVALVPKSAGLRAEGASLLMALGRPSEAEQLARQAIEIDPEQLTAIRVLADLAARRALSADADTPARQEAIRLYERLARSPDAEDDVYPILARLKLMGGDVAGAVEAVRTLAARRPGEPSAARLLAQYLDRAGRQDEAARTLAAFLSANPDAEELIPLLGDLARESDEWGPVEAACAKMIEAAPERPAARALRGEALLQLGRGREAVAELEKTRDMAPENRLVLFQLASAYGDVGRLSEAADLLRDLARDLPDQAGVRLFLGEVLSRQGDFDGAMESFRAGMRAIPSDEPRAAERRDAVRRRIAALWLGRSKFDEAAAALAGLERPDEPPSLEMRVRVAIRSGDTSGALALCKKLRDKGEAGPAASLEGEALARSGKLERAKARFEEAASLLGPEAWARAAETLRDAGHGKEAEETLREWARKEPGSGAARFGLGAFLEREKRYEEADAELEQAIRLDSKDAVALNYLGYSLAERGLRLEYALGLVRRALELDPWNPAYLDSLGWALYRLGRFEEARDPLERAATDLPRDATVLEHLGDVYERTGQSARAVSLWRRALEAGSANAEALNGKISRAGGAGQAVEPSRPRGAADRARDDSPGSAPGAR